MAEEVVAMEPRIEGERKISLGATGRALVAALALFVGAGCSQVEQNVILDVGFGSGVNVTPVFGLPPFGTPLVGSLDTTLTLSINVLDLLFGRPIAGTVVVNNILIAGPSVTLFGLATGTLCNSLDASMPSPDGTVSIDLKKSELTLKADVNTFVQPSGASFRSFLHDAGDFALPVVVDTVAPASIFDLLGALGGATFPIAFTQLIDFTIPITNPLLANAHVTGTLFLSSVDTPPVHPLLDICAAFLAGP
jgi:hypothetical protein